MAETLKTYTSDVDLLLAEVCMAGAMYGLDAYVTLIADHLKTQPRTQGAALLAQSLAKTVVRDYKAAIALAQQVMDNRHMARLHAEASAFKKLAEQLQNGQEASPLEVPETSPA